MKKEKFHLRDLTFNELHRWMGDDLYAVDLDFLEFTIEDNAIKLVAVVETKSEFANLNFYRLQHRSQQKLANDAKIPYIVVQYFRPDYHVIIYPRNSYAKKFVPDVQEMSLLSYTKLLYEMRGQKCPEDIIPRLSKSRISSIVREYKKQRLSSMEEELIKLKKELQYNGYKT